MYLCCCAGYTRQEADRLASQLHADGAVISTSLPDHTWLLLVLPEALKPDAYQPHTLVSVIIMITAACTCSSSLHIHLVSSRLFRCCSGTQGVVDPNAVNASRSVSTHSNVHLRNSS